MAKDVLYIDTEDDITAVIGKVTGSKESIVAIVPPKRTGVLHSAVNMRLLARAAQKHDKQIVLISGDGPLAGLAAAAKIPVAKTLQSKPELHIVPAAESDDADQEVIDGAALLPELAQADAAPAHDGPANDDSVAVDAVEREDKARKPVSAVVPRASGPKKKPKIPNFNSFRKKLFLIGGGLVLIIVFFVWAIWFAPHATIAITAQTTSVTANAVASLGETTNETTLKTTKKEEKKELSVEFTPTGKKKVGERSKGSVAFGTNSADLVDAEYTIPSGTQLTSRDGKVYTTTEQVKFTRDNRRRVEVGIIAKEVGSEYDGAHGSMTPKDIDSGVYADIATEPSGGSSREVTVVSRDDLARAGDLLKNKKESGAKERLKSQFDSQTLPMETTFTEQYSSFTPSVAQDSEASDRVLLRTTYTASMHGAARTDVDNFLKQQLQKQVANKDEQKVYSSGIDQVAFSEYSGGRRPTVRVRADGKIGPYIDEGEIKRQAKGKKQGDIQIALEKIDGVKDVSVKYSPFWVSTVPGDDKKVTVDFKIDK